MQFVPRQFFPSSDRTELLVDLTLPQNASIFASEEVAKRLDAALADDPDVERWSTYVGRGAIRFYLPLNVQLALPVLLPGGGGGQGPARRANACSGGSKPCWRRTSRPRSSRVYPLELGPPVGWPVQYRVNGPDIERVRDIAQEVAQAAWPTRPARATSISTGWSRPASCACGSTRTRRGASACPRPRLSTALNAALTGTTVTQVRDDIYLVDVVARATAEERLSLDTLRSLQVSLPGGRTVPLTQFATFELCAGIPADLAARPRADADRARRRRPGRAARYGGRRRCSRASTR